MLSPNGGESWTVGTSHTITWSQSNVDKVTIGYKTCASCLDWIVNNLPVNINSSTGSYTWNIPASLTVGSNYQIYILGYYTGVGSKDDTSDAAFSIVAAATTACTDSDNGKDYYVKGKSTGLYGSNKQTGWIFGEDPNKASSRYDSTLNYSVYYDHCFDSATSKQLNEGYCDANGLLQAEGITCPNGCKDGVCVSTPQPAASIENSQLEQMASVLQSIKAAIEGLTH